MEKGCVDNVTEEGFRASGGGFRSEHGGRRERWQGIVIPRLNKRRGYRQAVLHSFKRRVFLYTPCRLICTQRK